jgi:hypothetical protein
MNSDSADISQLQHGSLGTDVHPAMKELIMRKIWIAHAISRGDAADDNRITTDWDFDDNKRTGPLTVSE